MSISNKPNGHGSHSRARPALDPLAEDREVLFGLLEAVALGAFPDEPLTLDVQEVLNLSNDFQLRHLKNDMVYRKPSVGEERHDRWHRAAELAIDRVDGGRRNDR